MNKSVDITINVLAPLAFGVLIYFASFPYFIRYYLPDGLWAYAFTSCILIIWSRKLNALWLSILAIVFILFECGQAIKIFPGTADIRDVLVYLIFGALALVYNKLYNTKQIKNDTEW